MVFGKIKKMLSKFSPKEQDLSPTDLTESGTAEEVKQPPQTVVDADAIQSETLEGQKRISPSEEIEEIERDRRNRTRK